MVTVMTINSVSSVVSCHFRCQRAPLLQLLISFYCSQNLTVQFNRTGQADKGRVAGVKEQGFQSQATWGPIPALLLAAV